jgi:hypothetical protein
MRKILAVGWDVGGWRGSKQAVAVVRQLDQQREWVGRPRAFSIEALTQSGGSILDLIRLGWQKAPVELLDQYRIVLAIDAPLGFPVAFQQLIFRHPSRQPRHTIELGPEISNPFAYRETDRWVHQSFGKKPLSASFDKLGNVATVAMYHAERWANTAGIPIVPFQPDDGCHAIIEVYPALVKNPADGVCASRFARHLPDDLPPQSDRLDAAICALHALAYALHGQDSELPRLVGPPDILDQSAVSSEGWIYHFPPWRSSATPSSARDT